MRTEPRAALRNRAWFPRLTGERAMLLVILAIAAALRLWHVDFGLPALNDPDEPLFIMTALDMLRDHSLNPGWFGHPATLLFYALAAIFWLVGALGLATGRWPDAGHMAAAIYTDPGIVILPGRLFIVACGVACVYLTYRIGRRVAGPFVGLAAAALLACNALHVELSQVIRTDVLATVFMLVSTLFALRIAREGRKKDHLLAGAAAGLATATKWPAAVVLANAAGAILLRYRHDRRAIHLLPLAPIAAVAALLAASPFLLLDYPAVVRDLGGEARPIHLGATGHGLLANLAWYAHNVFAASFGWAGLVLAIAGVLLAPFRARAFAWAVLPGGAVFLLAIAAERLVWERWTVPLLPFAALAAAIALDAALKVMPARLRAPLAIVAGVGLLAPMLAITYARTQMRANDTRQAAVAWVAQHVPPDRSILIEHAGFDLFGRPGRILFPMGSAGCVDFRAALATRPRYAKVGKLRANKAIVDLGNVDPRLLASCTADIAIFSNYARYAAEPGRFAAQLAVYRTLTRDAKLLAVFRPIAEKRGGPTVYIVALARPAARDAGAAGED